MIWQAITLALAFVACTINAQVVPFDIDGALGSASASSTAFNSGGTANVNGLSIVIPDNFQVQFPAAFIPFKEVAAGGFLGSQVSITGNFVNGVPIAGLMQIAQFLTQAGNGVIQSLAFDGAITLRGGQVIRINDPNAVYSNGTTRSPFFTADDQNPSITAFSGFPMCVPRSANDPKCPASNRPNGQSTFAAPNPLLMAPFLPGDYIEFSGIFIGGEVYCYTILSPSVLITTTGVPAYLRVEEAIVGVYDADNAAVAEFADTRVVGYTSDSSITVLITRSEVNPCTGNVTNVAIGSATPRQGDTRGKWTWRADSTTITRYAREYKVTASSGTAATNGGQIIAGQYSFPIADWIFPELTAPGRIPPRNDFSNFLNLRNGPGPDANGNVWGQLKPWPDATTPAASPATCTPSSTTSTSTTSTTSTSPTPTSTKDTVIIDSYTWTSQQGGTLSVVAHSSNTSGTAKLTLTLNNPTPGAQLTMTDLGGGKFSYTVRSTKKPSNGITVTSSLGGSASLTTTTS